MSAPELRVATVGSILEETPEGLYRADRLRRRRDQELTELAEFLSPPGLRALQAVELELERRVLGLA